MAEFYECVLWGDLSSDKASEQYPTEAVCESCVNKYDTEEQEVIVSVGRHLGELDDDECFFSESH